MKLFDSVGKEHEEFKLRLNKDKEIELAAIHTQANIAGSQANVVSEALKHSKIDIVGGDAAFFDRITGAVTAGKALDKLIGSSGALTDVKETFFNSDPEYFHTQLKGFIDRFGLTSEDVKNLSVAAALSKMADIADDGKTKGLLTMLLGQSHRLGLAEKTLAAAGKLKA
jgi:hypothetical protein